LVTAKSDVFEDNNGALTVATTPRITPQSKFFAVKLHFFKEHVKTEANPEGEIHIQKIDTKDQLADLMTKGLGPIIFKRLRDRLMGWDIDLREPNDYSDSRFMMLGKKIKAKDNQSKSPKHKREIK
jgi:hypothetical protein